MVLFTVLWWMIYGIRLAITQETALPGPQCEDFASSYKLSAEQISRAQISNTTVHNVEIALNFERSNWATNSVTVDPFYRVPSNWSSTIPAGTLLTVENVTNTSLYTLPAAVSLSRITYQTVTLNGTSIPASAYILWPYLPRTFRNITGHPVIGWAHGTSGVLPECAPSHIRNLWYQYSGPYIMALQGYVVVAPDYAGLGVGHTSPSSPGAPPILHPYLSSASHAHDLVHAITAAQSAFPSLSASFVTIGHSQGGGTTWALSTSSSSPTPAGPSFLALLAAAARSNTALGPCLAAGLSAAFGVPQAELFTPAGQARWGLLASLGGCSNAAAGLFAPAAANASWIRANIAAHWAARALAAASDYSEKEPGTPLLVMQGLADGLVLPAWTEASVERTCGRFPQSAVEYVGFEGVTHVPVMYAGQRVWLDWVAERFEGRAVGRGCRKRVVRGAREEEGAYLAEFNYFLQPVTAGYQVA